MLGVYDVYQGGADAAVTDAAQVTPREIARFVGIGGRGPVVAGGPRTVADEMERWLVEADVDGFNLAFAVTPGGRAPAARPAPLAGQAHGD